MGEFTRKHNSGFSNWAVHKARVLSQALADRDDLVYLTADRSTNWRTSRRATYIIGGIVDRNRHKNLTLNKANEQGDVTCTPTHPRPSEDDRNAHSDGQSTDISTRSLARTGRRRSSGGALYESVRRRRRKEGGGRRLSVI